MSKAKKRKDESDFNSEAETENLEKKDRKSVV